MIQKLIDSYELEREMYRRCIDTGIEIEKGRAKWDSGLWIRYKVFEDAITVAPRVEAEPVKHGRWIKSTDADDGYCSVCKCDMPMFRNDWEWEYTETPYCPNCGSRMDLDEVEE